MRRAMKSVACKPHAEVPADLVSAIDYFGDPQFCQQLIATLRWAGGIPVCPLCGCNRSYYCSTRRVWKCKDCAKQFSVKLGTIFEDSHLTLEQWLPALWMTAKGTRGLSSRKLALLLGTTHRTIWFMLHRIRLTMRTDSFKRTAPTKRAVGRSEAA
jgi:transposase-like protein